MGRIFERSKKPVSAEAEPAMSLPEENGRRTRRKAVREDLPSEDSEDAYEAPRKPSVRGLSKREKQIMTKEAAQMRAGKDVHIARVSKQFSVAGFVTSSVSALSAKIPFKPISQQVSAVPALLPPRSDAQRTQSSAVVPTPDSEIGQYSSQQRPTTVDVRGPAEGEGEGTPTKRQQPVPGKGKGKPERPLVLGLDDSDSDSDDDEDGFKAMMKLTAKVDRQRDEEKRRLAFEEKQRVLKARKEAAVRAQKEAEVKPGSGKGARDVKGSFLKSVSRKPAAEVDVDFSDADEDLVILDKPTKPSARKRNNVRLNPKDALDVKREHGGKSRNGMLHFAPRQEVTESMFQHAGQTFDQAGKRHREGYATKDHSAAGSNKQAPITNEQSLAYLLEQQRRLAALERQKKERESGLKSRALQPRREQLVDDAILEETRKAEEIMMSLGEVEREAADEANDEDDSEDEDFAPEGDAEEEGSGAEIEAEGNVDMDDRVLVQETQTGETTEQDDAVMADEATPEGQEPEPLVATSVDPPEETEEELRQRKRKRAAVLDSDEEDESPRFPTAGVPKRVEFDSEGVPESSLISHKLSEHSEGPVMPSFGGGFDDFAGGFGELGGLSQFFGATQAPGASAATQRPGVGKGLDALRQGTPAAGGLAFGNLGAVVSATAQDRNMALLGANLGVDPHAGYTPKRPKQQYLNSQGLFTQTTPKLNPLQGQDSVMSIDDESMPFQQTAPISSEEPLLDPTYRSNHASSHQDDPEALDATPVASLSRLKRRREQEDEEDQEPPQDKADEPENDLPMEDAGVEEEEEEEEEEEDVAVPSSQPEPTFRPESAKLDVLQRMMAAARSPPKADRPHALSGMAKEYLENEAELDLEEDAFFNRLDDEDDDAEGDGVVENLVDDAARTKEQELEDALRRAEIDREYAEEEDARRQKIAQEVIEGKYKGKRRDGLDGVLSSDEEDDEDKRKARKKWRKEQERRARELKSNLAQLAHGETQAFVQAYQGGLASDDDDDEAEASQDQVPLEDDQAKDDDEEEDAPIVRNRRSIGIRDIEDQVRMIARQNREREEAMQNEPIELDTLPMPAAFVDSDTDQEESQITISRRRDEQRSWRRESTTDQSKFERWAAAPDNNDSRRAGARSAVTGGTSSSRSLGRNGTSNRSGSFAITSTTAGKKSDKSVKPRASAIMGGVLAKKSGFTDGP
ncbi:hypothetical protein NCC49_000017 [Naganishia albida]|nr:hypothetical protein NCC49_000017 [Naganishia albida]